MSSWQTVQLFQRRTNIIARLLADVRQVTSNIQHLTFVITETNPARRAIKCKKYRTTAVNLRTEAIVRSIHDAIFLLPVTRWVV